jgi:bleomycin hydrolase
MHKDGKKLGDLREEKLKILSDVYRILIISLGEPPSRFTWRYETKDGDISPEKTYTPMEFYKNFVGRDVEKYVLMMDDPSKEYYKRYDIKYYRNVWEGNNWTFVNVSSDELKKFAKKSILADQPIYFSCDFGKQKDSEKGYLALNIYDYDALFGVDFGMNKKARILTFESGSTHGMALMGLDTTAYGIVTKWLLENTHGKEKGDKGYVTMTDTWFDEYLFRLVIHEDFVSEKIRNIAKQKPVELPPWDPMF